MKKVILGLVISSLLLSFSCENTKKIQDVKVENASDSLSYALGVNIGESMKQQKLTEVNTEIMAAAIQAVLNDDTTALIMRGDSALMCINKYMMKKRDEEALKTKEEGIKFLEENGKKPGVITTASGLQYEVMKSGTGISPVANEQVTVHYTGKFIDGKVFDSSVERGQPATLPVNGFNKGFAEALHLMKEGDKWLIVIPSDLAYGPTGAGNVIPPNATLIFELELLKVNTETEPDTDK